MADFLCSQIVNHVVSVRQLYLFASALCANKNLLPTNLIKLLNFPVFPAYCQKFLGSLIWRAAKLVCPTGVGDSVVLLPRGFLAATIRLQNALALPIVCTCALWGTDEWDHRKYQKTTIAWCK